MTEDYLLELEKQFLNLDSPPIKFYFKWIYKQIEEQFDKNHKILEIGSGLGSSTKFMTLNNITRTDLISATSNGVIGNINAHKLPFSNEEFDGTFAVDALHHMSNPFKVIEELCRVTRTGGKIVFVEPYVSLTSYPIYKLFHSEAVSWSIKPTKIVDAVNAEAGTGNQTILQSVIKSGWIENNPQLHICRHLLFSPLSFFATGGINRPFKHVKWLIKILLKMENKLPRFLLKLTASRQMLVMEKK